MNCLLESLERLSNIKFYDNFNEPPIYVNYMNGMLAAEYFRRISVFLDHISSDLKTNYAILINAARMIGYDFSDVFANVINLEMINNSYIRAICMFYLEWSVLIDIGEETAIKFKELYEPLIRILENGGYFHMHHGDLIGGDGFGMIPYNRDRFSKLDPIDITYTGLFNERCRIIKNAEDACSEYLKTGRIEKKCLLCGGNIKSDSSFTHTANGRVYTYKSHYVVSCENANCFSISIRKENVDYEKRV